jgi:phosphoribosylformylglycinamidine synthase
VNLETERCNGEFVRGLIAEGLVSAVHDVSDGGVAVAAAEMTLASGLGFFGDIDIASAYTAGGMTDKLQKWIAAFLFAEDQARYLIACNRKDERQVVQAAVVAGRPISRFGFGVFGAKIDPTSESNSVTFELRDADMHRSNEGLSLPLADLRAAYEGWLPNYMKGGR